MPMINFDKERTLRLQKAYDLAVKAKLDQFTFEGHEYRIDYARYLLEYLRKEFNM